MLDVGTNRQELLDDPLYLGNRHPRVDRETYDAFIDAYVTAATKLFPDALLHWEDFGPANARRILDRYRDDGLHLQRRHPGHRRGQPGRRPVRRARRPACRCATTGS